ncbi:hypothetical protein V492_07704 [Pseudogymnoascus sp. VKM F-4246]|nr:hypothetical protein V492_07704 [Pseudogymnoascus sp. VKM F-4246]
MYKLRSDEADYVIKNKSGNPAQRRNDERNDRSKQARIEEDMPGRRQGNSMLLQKREDAAAAPRGTVARTWEGKVSRPPSFEYGSSDSEDDLESQIIVDRRPRVAEHYTVSQYMTNRNSAKTIHSTIARPPTIRRQDTTADRRIAGNTTDGSDDSSHGYQPRPNISRMNKTTFRSSDFVSDSEDSLVEESGSDSPVEDDDRFSITAQDEFEGAHLQNHTNFDSTVDLIIPQATVSPTISYTPVSSTISQATISSTISQDKTSGEGARNAEMLAEFAQKCLRFPGPQEETLSATRPPYSRFPDVRDRSESRRARAFATPIFPKHEQTDYASGSDGPPSARFTKRETELFSHSTTFAAGGKRGEEDSSASRTSKETLDAFYPPNRKPYYRPIRGKDPRWGPGMSLEQLASKATNDIAGEAGQYDNIAPNPNAQMMLLAGINPGNLTAQQFQNFPGQARGGPNALQQYNNSLAQQQQQSQQQQKPQQQGQQQQRPQQQFQQRPQQQGQQQKRPQQQIQQQQIQQQQRPQQQSRRPYRY